MAAATGLGRGVSVGVVVGEGLAVGDVAAVAVGLTNTTLGGVAVATSV